MTGFAHTSNAPAVDVIIPVFNAPVLSKRCIESVITYLGSSIQAIHIQDDASDRETAAMLDQLSCPLLHIVHAPNNQGYGASVNEAIARSKADFVLVLNSDTELHENILPPLCNAFMADSQLAVISPVHQDVKVRFERYRRQPGGYILTHRFQGYGFLIRRELFNGLGGFDRQFGRGYFEDTDLGRRLDGQGWRIGVHPDAHILHAVGASFGRGQSYRKLVAKNRAKYLARYPGAHQNIVLISGRSTYADLPDQLIESINHVLRQGGVVHWLTPAPVQQLPSLQLRNRSISFKRIVKLILRGWSREDKRVSAIWVLPGVSVLLRLLITLWVRMRSLEMRTWKTG
ncbi:glycosyltransferase [Nitrosomonas sp. JL21]|uniref:glycosyltransferase family 2 protein n=1 Tax=Nitrosomonas sp. JL21 TaxID=153949 RepID=UPI00136A4B16|nr:glycosyltransferase [Nitrosomonas sp. JL21]MBL8496928.1 glycosyltransferase [Nitrosomonas sp.]MXS78501.1 glycosyltransferase [Nitrosomonas sp. JL21]